MCAASPVGARAGEVSFTLGNCRRHAVGVGSTARAGLTVSPDAARPDRHPPRGRADERHRRPRHPDWTPADGRVRRQGCDRPAAPRQPCALTAPGRRRAGDRHQEYSLWHRTAPWYPTVTAGQPPRGPRLRRLGLRSRSVGHPAECRCGSRGQDVHRRRSCVAAGLIGDGHAARSGKANYAALRFAMMSAGEIGLSGGVVREKRPAGSPGRQGNPIRSFDGVQCRRNRRQRDPDVRTHQHGGHLGRRTRDPVRRRGLQAAGVGRRIGVHPTGG